MFIFYTFQQCLESHHELGECEVVHDWQLDCVWNQLQSRNGGHTLDPDLEAGRQHVFDLILEVA